jgi:hypothetical protein
MKVVVRYLLIGRRYHRGILSGRPAGCKHIGVFKVLRQDSRACWARKFAMTSRSLSVQGRIISSSIPWRYRVRVITRSLRAQVEFRAWHRQFAKTLFQSHLTRFASSPFRFPHWSASRVDKPTADLISTGELVQLNLSPYPALSVL